MTNDSNRPTGLYLKYMQRLAEQRDRLPVWALLRARMIHQRR